MDSAMMACLISAPVLVAFLVWPHVICDGNQNRGANESSPDSSHFNALLRETLYHHGPFCRQHRSSEWGIDFVPRGCYDSSSDSKGGKMSPTSVLKDGVAPLETPGPDHRL